MAISNPGTPSWPRLLAQWRLSGLTQAEFCARRGLSLPAFRYNLPPILCRKVRISQRSIRHISA
jgi:hypothetical protein